MTPRSPSSWDQCGNSFTVPHCPACFATVRVSPLHTMIQGAQASALLITVAPQVVSRGLPSVVQALHMGEGQLSLFTWSPAQSSESVQLYIISVHILYPRPLHVCATVVLRTSKIEMRETADACGRGQSHSKGSDAVLIYYSPDSPAHHNRTKRQTYFCFMPLGLPFKGSTIGCETTHLGIAPFFAAFWFGA